MHHIARLRDSFSSLCEYIWKRNPRLIKREVMFLYQHFTRGFADDETWSLDSTVADFILPRLRVLRKREIGYPSVCSEEDWYEILGEIEWLMEITSEFSIDQADPERYKKATELFGKYFNCLWD